jgi:hypothetical protein
MENADLLTPFALRGTSPAMGGFDMMGDYERALTMFSYMPNDWMQKWSANHFLSGAYDANMAFNQPNIFDKSNLDFQAAYPGEHHTPIIPLISPTTMPYIMKGLQYGGMGLGMGGRAIGSGFEAVGDWISRKVFGVGDKKKNK